MSLQKRRIEEGQNNRKLSNKLRSARRHMNNLPFELSLESISDIEKFQRAQDKVALKKFNKDVEDWSEDTKDALRRVVKAEVKRDVYLSDSLKANLYYDRKYAKEVNRVGFSFVREGIYIHKGAGRGQGGIMGSRWIDKHGSIKHRDPASAGLQGTGNRKPIKWFDPVVASRLPRLGRIVSDYSATMQINATNIFIDDRP